MTFDEWWLKHRDKIRDLFVLNPWLAVNNTAEEAWNYQVAERDRLKAKVEWYLECKNVSRFIWDGVTYEDVSYYHKNPNPFFEINATVKQAESDLRKMLEEKETNDGS
jgi:hypothetical protein